MHGGASERRIDASTDLATGSSSPTGYAYATVDFEYPYASVHARSVRTLYARVYAEMTSRPAATAPHMRTSRRARPMTAMPAAQTTRTTKTFGRVIENHRAAARNVAALLQEGARLNRSARASVSTPADTDTESPCITPSQLATGAVHGTSRTSTTVSRLTDVRRIPAATTSARVDQTTNESSVCAITMALSPGHSAIQTVAPQGRT